MSVNKSFGDRWSANFHAPHAFSRASGRWVGVSLLSNSSSVGHQQSGNGTSCRPGLVIDQRGLFAGVLISDVGTGSINICIDRHRPLLLLLPAADHLGRYTRNQVEVKDLAGGGRALPMPCASGSANRRRVLHLTLKCRQTSAKVKVVTFSSRPTAIESASAISFFFVLSAQQFGGRAFFFAPPP